jgi:hypothetical protein
MLSNVARNFVGKATARPAFARAVTTSKVGFILNKERN